MYTYCNGGIVVNLVEKDGLSKRSSVSVANDSSMKGIAWLCVQ